MESASDHPISTTSVSFDSTFTGSSMVMSPPGPALTIRPRRSEVLGPLCTTSAALVPSREGVAERTRARGSSPLTRMLVRVPSGRTRMRPSSASTTHNAPDRSNTG
ncbi:unannotated protein [freshwater metagenome]|uniref:Unannotated protein n=1 Tax=freshwater metagenome TaxID=449393 RepID=A0A6J7QYI7_9ZZZZ